MVETGVAILLTGLVIVLVARFARNQRELIWSAVSAPRMHNVVDPKLRAFVADPMAAPPDTQPAPAGDSDAGETLHLLSASRWYGDLGLRTYDLSAIVPGTVRYALGGAARLEPLTLPPWQPDFGSLNMIGTTYQLTVLPGNSSRGRVRGSGMFAIGDSAVIVAEPFSGAVFLRWEGSAYVASRTSATTTVIVDEDRTITAIFSP